MFEEKIISKRMKINSMIIKINFEFGKSFH